MARPKKSDALDATSFVGIRISAEMRAKLEVMAVQNGRDISGEVRAALERHTGIKTKRR
jgi:predicted DNA-binding protein